MFPKVGLMGMFLNGMEKRMSRKGEEQGRKGVKELSHRLQDIFLLNMDLVHSDPGKETMQLLKKIPFWALIKRFPKSNVTYAVPFRTMSMTVLQAFGDSLSDGDTKFPAALLMIISGRPHLFSQKSMAAATCDGSRTSAATGKT